MISYRSARVDDAPGIATVHVLTWRVAYRGQVPQDHLDSLSVAERTGGWARILAELEGPAAVLVAEEEGAIVGFASILPSRDEDAAPGTGELAALYVDPDRWDHGVGRELLARALGLLGAAGCPGATLWVLATNTRARRFYAVAGWSPDGGVQTTRIGGAELAEVRYRIELPIGPGPDPSVTSRE